MQESKPFGRPTDYRPEYCQMLIDHMASGLSYLSFAAVVDCNESTLYEWEQKNPDFSNAKKDALSKNRLFWEKLGINHITNGPQDQKLNSTVYIFNMKNRFPKEWRDRIELSGDDKPLQITMNYERKKKKPIQND